MKWFLLIFSIVILSCLKTKRNKFEEEISINIKEETENKIEEEFIDEYEALPCNYLTDIFSIPHEKEIKVKEIKYPDVDAEFQKTVDCGGLPFWGFSLEMRHMEKHFDFKGIFDYYTCEGIWSLFPKKDFMPWDVDKEKISQTCFGLEFIKYEDKENPLNPCFERVNLIYNPDFSQRFVGAAKFIVIKDFNDIKNCNIVIKTECCGGILLFNPSNIEVLKGKENICSCYDLSKPTYITINSEYTNFTALHSISNYCYLTRGCKDYHCHKDFNTIPDVCYSTDPVIEHFLTHKTFAYVFQKKNSKYYYSLVECQCSLDNSIENCDFDNPLKNPLTNEIVNNPYYNPEEFIPIIKEKFDEMKQCFP